MSKRTQKCRSLSCALALGAALQLTLACAGPERTPHQPIKGVDTDANEVHNPHDATEKPGGAPTSRPSGSGSGGSASGGSTAQSSGAHSRSAAVPPRLEAPSTLAQIC